LPGIPGKLNFGFVKIMEKALTFFCPYCKTLECDFDYFMAQFERQLEIKYGDLGAFVLFIPSNVKCHNDKNLCPHYLEHVKQRNQRIR